MKTYKPQDIGFVSFRSNSRSKRDADAAIKLYKRSYEHIFKGDHLPTQVLVRVHGKQSYTKLAIGLCAPQDLTFHIIIISFMTILSDS